MLKSRLRPPHWHDASGIIPCHECDGDGEKPNRPWLNSGDPDCWPVPCPECNGAGYHPCSVCGFEHEVPGYDCPICLIVSEMTPEHIKSIKPADIADAFAAAMNVALNAEARS